MVLITIVTGAYKPTYNWGASHCRILDIRDMFCSPCCVNVLIKATKKFHEVYLGPFRSLL